MKRRTTSLTSALGICGLVVTSLLASGIAPAAAAPVAATVAAPLATAATPVAAVSWTKPIHAGSPGNASGFAAVGSDGVIDIASTSYSATSNAIVVRSASAKKPRVAKTTIVFKSNVNPAYLDDVRLVASPRGGARLVWILAGPNTSTGKSTSVAYSATRKAKSKSWTKPVRLGAAAAIDVGVDSTGRYTAAWESNGRIRVSTASGSKKWAAPRIVPGTIDDTYPSTLELAVATDGTAVIAAKHWDPRRESMVFSVTTRASKTGTWKRPRVIARGETTYGTDTSIQVHVAAAKRGAATVSIEGSALYSRAKKGKAWKKTSAVGEYNVQLLAIGSTRIVATYDKRGKILSKTLKAGSTKWSKAKSVVSPKRGQGIASSIASSGVAARGALIYAIYAVDSQGSISSSRASVYVKVTDKRGKWGSAKKIGTTEVEDTLYWGVWTKSSIDVSVRPDGGRVGAVWHNAAGTRLLSIRR